MKFKYLIEDEGCADCADGDSGGTTSADIAQYTVKLGDIIRRKKIEEGYYSPDVVSNVSLAFYNNGRSDDEFTKCFDVQSLRIDVINLFKRRSLRKDPLKIIEDDEHVTELATIINKHCKHDHIWKFEGFKQYGTQIVFGTTDTECKVVIYQHF